MCCAGVVGERAERLVWLDLFIDMAVLATLTLLTDTTAARAWTPYLLLTASSSSR